MGQEVYADATVWRGIKHIHAGKRMNCLICKELIESGQDVMTIWFKKSEPRDYHTHCIRQLVIMMTKLLLEG